MGPYSMDLRERVIAAVDAHEGSLRQLARRYRIGTAMITRWLRRRRRWGTIAPQPHGGGHPPALDAAARCRLRAAVRKQPDATLQELAQRIGVQCSRMAIFRALKKVPTEPPALGRRCRGRYNDDCGRRPLGAARTGPLVRPSRRHTPCRSHTMSRSHLDPVPPRAE